MTMSYEESYLGQIRQLVGKRKLIIVTARAIIRDQSGRVLFIRRRDNEVWAMPAGSMELDESISECLIREVKEETGLEVISFVPIAIHSHPRFSFTTVCGEPYQRVSIVFLVEEWGGELLTETAETIDARFSRLGDLPRLPEVYLETLEDLQAYDGRVIVK